MDESWDELFKVLGWEVWALKATITLQLTHFSSQQRRLNHVNQHNQKQGKQTQLTAQEIIQT